MRRGFGFIGIIVTLLVAGIAGTIGYNAGLSAGTTATTGGATVVYAPWGPGFGFLGTLLGILFIIFIVRMFAGGMRHAAWGGHGGSFGPGGPHGAGGPASRGGKHGRHDAEAGHWDSHTLPPMFEPMLQSWHRQAHGATPTADPASTGDSNTATGPTAGERPA